MWEWMLMGVIIRLNIGDMGREHRIWDGKLKES